MTEWWDEVTAMAGAVDFGWNAAAFYSIMAPQLAGRRLSSNMADYAGYLPSLARQSTAEMMSSAGATSKGPPNQTRQAERKSTTLLTFAVDTHLAEPMSHQEVGRACFNASKHYPSRHQSLFASATTVLRFNGSRPIVTRTETKEQSGGGREFSAGNDVAIISTRCVERIMAAYLPQQPIDRMVDPCAEDTLADLVCQKTEGRSLRLAADCTRFGPNQVMAKSRAYAACLLLSDPGHDYDHVASSYSYELMAEPTRLTQHRFTKMPFELFTHLVDSGGLKQVRSHNPTSTLGRMADIMIESLSFTTVPIGYELRYGMSQGSMGNLSSGPSSELHYFACEVMKEDRLAQSINALVTNDDSYINLTGVPEDLELRPTSIQVKAILKRSLGLGGQLLNTVKTVVSSFLGEFHSMFATEEGLIVPELKAMAAAFQFGGGERMSDDAALVIETGVSLLRSGVSLLSATVTSLLANVAHCDQYNRWPALRQHGPRPAELGGPVSINLLKEILIPGYGSLMWYAEANGVDRVAVTAKVVTQLLFSAEEDDLINTALAGIAMTTRKLYRDARGNKEICWLQPQHALPLSRMCTVGHLMSAISSGLLRSTRESGADKLLTRLGRNQVSSSAVNLSVPEHSWVATIVGSRKLSYKDLDAISQQRFASYTPLDPLHPSLIPLAGAVEQLLVACLEVGRVSHTFGQLVRGAASGVRDLTVQHVTVQAQGGLNLGTSSEAAIRSWGSAQLKRAFLSELAGRFDVEAGPGLIPEFQSALAVARAVSKLGRTKAGGYKIASSSSHVVSQRELVVNLASHAIRGMRTVQAAIPKFIQILDEVSILRPEPEPVLENDPFHVVLAKLSSATHGLSGCASIPDGNIEPLLISAPRGWHRTRYGRSKVKLLSRMLYRGGSRSVSNVYLITQQPTPGRYEHFVYSRDGDVDLRGCDGLKGQYSRFQNLMLKRGQVAMLGHKDRVWCLASADCTSIQLDIVNNSIVAATQRFAWPVKHVHPKIRVADPQPADQRPMMSDALVFLTCGNSVYADNQVQELMMVPIDEYSLDLIAAKQLTSNLLNAVRDKRFVELDQPNDDWLTANCRMHTLDMSVPPDVPWFEEEDHGIEEYEYQWYDEGVVWADAEEEVDPEEEYMRQLQEFNADFEIRANKARAELDDALAAQEESGYDPFVESEALLAALMAEDTFL